VGVARWQLDPVLLLGLFVGMDRRSSLLSRLGQAQSKILSLEEHIREREKQLRSVVGRFERSDSRSLVTGGRLRRAGLSHNLLRTMSQEEDEQEESEEEGGSVKQMWREGAV
jgi:hypothetical protein